MSSLSIGLTFIRVFCIRALCVSMFFGLGLTSYAQDHLLPNQYDPREPSVKSTLFEKAVPGIWAQPTSLSASETQKKESILLGHQVFHFQNLEEAPDGLFRFKVRSEKNPDQTNLSLIAGKSAHSILIRKALLEKLGFHVVPAIHLSSLKLEFHEKSDKKTFLNKLEHRTDAEAARWIQEDQKDALVLQDLVLIDESPGEFNPILGELSKEALTQYPLLQTMILPFVLTDLTESMNLFSWTAGRIFNNGVQVRYNELENYQPCYSDLKSLLERLALLNRQDWEEISQSSKLPHEVTLLLSEKLIARRNSMMELFSILTPEIEFNPEINHYPHLVDGKITREKWEGYASHFTSGSPDSPFNRGEMFAFTRFGLYSSILNNAVNLLNNIAVFKTEPQALLQNALKGGFDFTKNRKLVLGAWGFPFASGELIFSRYIVTGTFMGTDNLFQLADQFGFRVSIGAQLKLEELAVPFAVGFRGQVAFSRTYSHIKPIKSIKKALRYGFKNAIVPYFMKKAGKKLSPIFDEEFERLSFEEKKRVYQDALEDFKNQIAPGESILITDSLVGEGAVSGSVNLYRIVDLTLGAGVNELVMSRLHIHRKDESTFQVYKDFGEATEPSFGIEIGIKKPVPPLVNLIYDKDRDLISSAHLPIIRAKISRMKGHTETRFFPIPVSSLPNDESSLEIAVEQLRALQKTILSGSIELLSRRIKPYILRTEFKERNTRARFLVLSHRRIKTDSVLSITDPKGFTREFTRDFFGKSTAYDYNNTASNVLDLANQLITGSQFEFGADNTINPGYTTNGHARNDVLTFEAEVDEDDQLKNPFVKFSKSRNGWKLSKKKLLKILNRYANDYGGSLFPDTALNETEQMFLYNVSLDVFIYAKALDHLMSLSEEKIRGLFARYGVDLTNRLADDRIVDRINEFKETHSAKSLMKAITLADRLLPAEGFIEFLGGKQNIFITAKIDGFRKGDENVDSPIISNSIGIAGSSQREGPLTEIRKNLGMTEGEFLSLWILNRIL